MYRRRGSDVHDDTADIHRKPAFHHLASGQRVDQLLLRSLLIADAEGNHVDFILGGKLRHFLNGIRLVLLDADKDAVDFQDFRGNGCSDQRGLAPVQHETMVGGQIRLALGSVDDEGVDVLFRRRREFDVSRKRRAAHSDDSGVEDAFLEQLPVGVLPVRYGIESGAPFILTVGDDLHRLFRRAGHPDDFHHISDRSAGGGVQRNRNESAGFRNALSFFDRIAFFHTERRRRADALTDRDNVFFKQRGDPQFPGCRELLAFPRMHASAELYNFLC